VDYKTKIQSCIWVAVLTIIFKITVYEMSITVGSFLKFQILDCMCTFLVLGYIVIVLYVMICFTSGVLQSCYFFPTSVMLSVTLA
jgi:hypothetical protein